MARPRKTLEQLFESGTFRSDRHAHLLPPAGNDLPCSRPAKPAGLTAEERAKWEALMAALGPAASGKDAALLTEFCRWASRGDLLASAIGGMTPGDAEYGKTIIAAAICCDKLLALSARFGLSPADRLKLRTLITTAALPRGKVAARQPSKMDLTPPGE